MSRRNRSGDRDWSGVWIGAFLLGLVLLIVGNANDDTGATLCPRSSHYCVVFQ